MTRRRRQASAVRAAPRPSLTARRYCDGCGRDGLVWVSLTALRARLAEQHPVDLVAEFDVVVRALGLRGSDDGWCCPACGNFGLGAVPA